MVDIFNRYGLDITISIYYKKMNRPAVVFRIPGRRGFLEEM